MNSFSRYRFVFALVVTSFLFTAIYTLTYIVSYAPSWAGAPPEVNFAKDWGVVGLLVLICSICVLSAQAILTLPIVTFSRSHRFQSMSVVTLYITFILCLIFCALQWPIFIPPDVMTGPNLTDLTPISKADPERYAKILDSWRRETIERCLSALFSALISSIVFWWIYSGSPMPRLKKSMHH